MSIFYDSFWPITFSIHMEKIIPLFHFTVACIFNSLDYPGPARCNPVKLSEEDVNIPVYMYVYTCMTFRQRLEREMT